MNNPSKPGFPSEIRDVHEQLRRDMRWLHAQTKVYRELFLNADNHRIAREAARDFTVVVEGALITAIVMALSRMTDNSTTFNKANLSLRRLFELLQAHGNAPALYARCERRINEIFDLLAPLKDFRHQVVAHRDLSAAMTMQPIPLPIPLSRIDELCSELGDVLNDIDDHFTESITSFEYPIEVGGVANLIHFLQRGIQGFDDDERDRFRGR